MSAVRYRLMEICGEGNREKGSGSPFSSGSFDTLYYMLVYAKILSVTRLFYTVYIIPKVNQSKRGSSRREYTLSYYWSFLSRFGFLVFIGMSFWTTVSLTLTEVSLVDGVLSSSLVIQTPNPEGV